ncbi:MAG: cation diffusion facilitator family transporter [Sphingomonadales bacterium]|jgi:ferrous-iron efflux pump FieF
MTELNLLKSDGQKAMKRAAYASVAMALSLIIAKLISWWLSSSVSMLGSLLDSGLDLVASLVTFVAVRAATLPADENHRFGHGKAEALASLFQSAILTGSATFLVLQAFERFAEPKAVSAPDLGIIVSVFAIAATLALVAYQRSVVRSTGSIAIEADSLHYAGDIYLNLSVIAAFIANSYFGILWVDPALALVIAGILGWNAFSISKRSIDMLMDKEWDEEERQKIIGLILENPQVAGVHELRTRSAGTDDFIQFHLSVDPQMSVADAHTISDEVEAILGEHYPRAEILIHIDPIGLVEHGEQKAII